MLPPSILADEDARLRAVEEYEPYAPFEDAAYAPVLELVRELFDVPIAVVSFIDRHELVFPVKRGLELCGIDRDISFCAHVATEQDLLVVLDATLDPRFRDSPLVTGEPHIRFYAGAPLVSPAGHVIGTLCLVDGRPRDTFPELSRQHLRRLGEIVLDRLELRRLRIAGGVDRARFENIAATSPDGIICADDSGHITFWNAAAERLFGHSRADALGRSLDLIVPPRMRGVHHGGLTRVTGGGIPKLVGKIVELTALRADGSEFPIELSLSMWQEPAGLSFGAILRDITERQDREAQLFRLAHHDALTDLPNRLVLRERVRQLAAGDQAAALLVLDLDRFKSVNDDLGHPAGDAVLREVGRRLLECVRSTDTVARMGGDEFAILLPGVADRNQAQDVADVVIRSVARPITAGGQSVNIGVSIGIALYPGDGSTADALVSSADLALYEAKHDGRHCHRLFTPALRQAVDRARAYDTQLRRAVDRGEFELFYQPQLRLADGALMGAEALLRWRHPDDGLLSPAAFLPGLENRPISVEVGEWILGTACLQAAAWRRMGADDFRIGVNLFGSQFRTGDLVERVHAALATAGLPAPALELEVTENIILRHDENMLLPLRRLRDAGVQIAFDDYGTGYASLSLLKRFPITRLKVDKGFVQGICESPQDAAIVRAILFLARSLGLAATAEGVETEEQARRLRRKGCDEVQGYLFGRPMPAPQFADRFGLSGTTSGYFSQNSIGAEALMCQATG